MSIIKEKLESLNIILPPAPAPAANYVPTVKSGNLIFVSGQIPVVDGNMIVGKVGYNIEIEEAVAAARACGLAIIAQLNEATNSNLDKISRIVKLGGFVNCIDTFTQQPEIINGASNLMVEVFGETGKHSRFAVGASSLPRGVVVEVEAIAEIK
jgi:enamine deaminase RidA (YjgF/YER057c/UK114 family)